MSVRRGMNKLRGRAIAAFLASAPRLRQWTSALRHDRRVTLFAAVDDPYTYLLAQTLPSLMEAAGAPLEVKLVDQPTGDVDAAQRLRLDHGRRDARLLAHYLEVDFAGPDGVPPAPLVELAQAIAAIERPAMEQLAALRAIGAALWAHDLADLEAVAAELGIATTEDAAARLRAGRRDLERMGHFLPGILHHQGAWHWGLDRLPDLADRLSVTDYRVPRRGTEPSPDELLPGDLRRDADGRPILEFWFSFRSPYSYLALERTFELAERYPIALQIRLVLPMVMRGLSVPRVKRLYIVFDAARAARRHGIPFGHICDPLGAGIARCLAAWPAANAAGRGEQFLLSAGRGIWSEALDVAHDADLRLVVERAGLDWDAVAPAVADAGSPAAPWRARAEADRLMLLEAGLWGVPCYRIGGHALWGQDRLWVVEDLVRRAVAAG